MSEEYVSPTQDELAAAQRIYDALKAADDTGFFLHRPGEGFGDTESVIDGCFDLVAVARALGLVRTP